MSERLRGDSSKERPLDAQKTIDSYLKSGIVVSKDLPSEDFHDEDYAAVITRPYIMNPPEHSDKTEFFEALSHPDVGWKVHLNVAPKDVAAVSDYLKSGGYVHKYLSGSKISEGKVFTVYIGSWRMVQELSRVLSRDLSGRLLRPVAEEHEFAPGVVGRFVSSEGTSRGARFHSYGKGYGFSMLQDRFDQVSQLDARIAQAPTAEEKSSLERDKAHLLARANIDSFNTLRQEYGDYFFKEPAAA